MTQQTVLSIDPGSRAMGWAILDSDGAGLYRARGYGVLRYSGRLSFRDRLLRIHQDVYELLEEHAPDALAIEKAFVGESVQSAMKLGEARAAVIIAAGRVVVPVFEITPAEAKKSVAGNGRASKEQVRGMVSQLLSLPETIALDASDALCLGLAYFFRRELVGDSLFDELPKRRRKSRGSRWTMDDIAERGVEFRESG